MPGNKKVIERYAGCYRAPFEVSEGLRAHVKVAVSVGVFRQNEAALTAWFNSQPEPIKSEIALYGMSQVLIRVKARDLKGPAPALAASRHDKKVATRVREKAKAFDRIVELLDHLDVNGKVLGDCTRADLLRAAVQLDQQSEDAKVRAAMYRELAAIVGNKTVREASNRGQIVALLTTTFKEAA